jgi:hypothetical protein
MNRIAETAALTTQIKNIRRKTLLLEVDFDRSKTLDTYYRVDYVVLCT